MTLVSPRRASGTYDRPPGPTTQGGNANLWMDSAYQGMDTSNYTEAELQAMGLPTGMGRDPFSQWREGRDEWDPKAWEAQNRAGPELMYGAQRDDLIGMMMQRARGEGPSAAQSQLQMGIDKTLASQRAATASNRGTPVGASSRALGMQASQTQLQGAQQLATLRAQEQSEAQQIAARTMQESAAMGLNAEQQQRAMNDQLTTFYLKMGLSIDEANRQAEIQRVNLLMGNEAMNTQANTELGAAGIQAGATAAATIGAAAASDKKFKANVRKADTLVEQMLDELSPQQWDYKDPKHGGKDHVGVMAQDVAKSELGKSIVREESDGLYLDNQRMITTAMAALARNHHRIKKLEAGLKSKAA